MVSGHLAGSQLSASGTRSTTPSATGTRLLPAPVRAALSLIVGFAALLIVAAAFGASPWSWLLWIVAGVVAGAVGRRMTLLWVAPVIVAAFYATAMALGVIEDPGRFWILGAVVGTILVGAGFALGTLVAWRESPTAAIATGWARLSGAQRALIAGVVTLVVAAFVAYTGYFMIAGSDQFMHPASGSTACGTPATAFGWQYQAINYDPADDVALAAENADRLQCSSQGTMAGDELVASDGVRLAGWYIPAASQVGPAGPTILIVPGFNSNKSDILEFAPPFHDRYNLMLLDLRNQGRSSPAAVTSGLNEQRDVAAALDWLVATKHPSAIAAMGNSMGAATLLAEARTDPRIQAFILDSMHANYEVMLGNALEVDYGFPSLPGAVAIRIGSDLRTGGDVRAIDPVRTITQVGDRPVLLLHSTTDRIDPPAVAAERNHHAALEAGVPVQLEYCEGLTTGNGSHGHVIDQCPADWSRWANEFLDAALAS